MMEKPIIDESFKRTKEKLDRMRKQVEKLPEDKPHSNIIVKIKNDDSPLKWEITMPLEDFWANDVEPIIDYVEKQIRILLTRQMKKEVGEINNVH